MMDRINNLIFRDPAIDPPSSPTISTPPASSPPAATMAAATPAWSPSPSLTEQPNVPSPDAADHSPPTAPRRRRSRHLTRESNAAKAPPSATPVRVVLSDSPPSPTAARPPWRPRAAAQTRPRPSVLESEPTDRSPSPLPSAAQVFRDVKRHLDSNPDLPPEWIKETFLALYDYALVREQEELDAARMKDSPSYDHSTAARRRPRPQPGGKKRKATDGSAGLPPSKRANVASPGRGEITQPKGRKGQRLRAKMV
ncbi:MAG: hypothetical protein M1826_004922 [Phylliscum demangeonii]|nr:MAG: hypothetical protein M1826_004922 [Phylliscum demangeonii]